MKFESNFSFLDSLGILEALRLYIILCLKPISIEAHFITLKLPIFGVELIFSYRGRSLYLLS